MKMPATDLVLAFSFISPSAIANGNGAVFFVGSQDL